MDIGFAHAERTSGREDTSEREPEQEVAEVSGHTFGKNTLDEAAMRAISL